MKIYNTTINESNPPKYEILLDVLESLHPKKSKEQIVKEIKKLGIYDLQKDASKSGKRKKISTANDRNTNNIQ